MYTVYFLIMIIYFFFLCMYVLLLFRIIITIRRRRIEISHAYICVLVHLLFCWPFKEEKKNKKRLGIYSPVPPF